MDEKTTSAGQNVVDLEGKDSEAATGESIRLQPCDSYSTINRTQFLSDLVFGDRQPINWELPNRLMFLNQRELQKTLWNFTYLCANLTSSNATDKLTHSHRKWKFWFKKCPIIRMFGEKWVTAREDIYSEFPARLYVKEAIMIGSLKILLIDDDQDFRASVRSLLESKGYVVLEADSGKEGLRKVVEQRPDIVVLDIMMECDVEGYGVNQAIKYQDAYADYRNIPIVMTSSIELSPDERFPMAGETDMIRPDFYLTKPLDIPKFLEVVQRAAALCPLHREP